MIRLPLGRNRLSIFVGFALFLTLALLGLTSAPQAPGRAPLPPKKKDKYDRAMERGLEWLALHQAKDGHWSLQAFCKDARAKRSDGDTFTCNCDPGVKTNSDIAATAFGLLPFLAAGYGNKPPDKKGDYNQTVEVGLKYLLAKQNKDGSFDKDMYANGLAARALCEIYARRKDDKLKESAQKSLDFIVDAQDPMGGGWRYRPREAGDLSVTGWQVRALKSGQLAGLKVPINTLKFAERFVDACESSQGNFSYVPGQPPTIGMTAVGLLCRQYSGVGPKNPALQTGVRRLKHDPPGINDNLYYLYYANEVMFHMQGDSWRFWDTGVNEDGEKVHKGMRDWLLERQDKGEELKHQLGSWGGTPGGRIMATSLALLILEQRNRTPLYRRELTEEEK